VVSSPGSRKPLWFLSSVHSPRPSNRRQRRRAAAYQELGDALLIGASVKCPRAIIESNTGTQWGTSRCFH